MGNIGTRERMQRFVMGVTSASAAVALSLMAIAFEASPWWLVAVFAMAYSGALGLLQARQHT